MKLLLLTFIFFLGFSLISCDNLATNNKAKPGLKKVSWLKPWPPEIGKAYPDLKLIGSDGKTVSLSSFKGKVLLIEPIGMNCAACNAYAGGLDKDIGGFKGSKPQHNLMSAEEALAKYAAGTKIDDERLVFIHLLLYNFKMQAPTLADVKAWEEHFQVSKKYKGKVFAPITDVRSPVAYNLIPGFQIIDKNFILRFDSSGHHPKNNLWEELLPALPKILEE